MTIFDIIVFEQYHSRVARLIKYKIIKKEMKGEKNRIIDE